MPASTSASTSRVLATSKGSPTASLYPSPVRRGNIGITRAPVSRAIRMEPGGIVVSRPKNDIRIPFWKKS
jgi:hypothetical protein